VISSHPNHVWGIDITYICLQKHWMYLITILDWYSRYVVNWQLDLCGNKLTTLPTEIKQLPMLEIIGGTGN
jgi:transposase InsO family protein